MIINNPDTGRPYTDAELKALEEKMMSPTRGALIPEQLEEQKKTREAADKQAINKRDSQYFDSSQPIKSVPAPIVKAVVGAVAGEEAGNAASDYQKQAQGNAPPTPQPTRSDGAQTEMKAGQNVDPQQTATTAYTAKDVMGDQSQKSSTVENTPSNQAGIKAGDVKNKSPATWFDYLKMQSGGRLNEDGTVTGGKVGAISRIAANALQGLGNAAQGFAYGASRGKTPAPTALPDDPYGYKGYGELQQNVVNQNQGLQGKAEETNIDEQARNNERAFQEKMQDKGFRNSMLMLAQNFENQKEMLGLNEKQTKSLQQFAADLNAGDNVRAFNTLAKSGITEDEMASFVKKMGGQRAWDDFLGLLGPVLGKIPSDINAKQDIKPTPNYSFTFGTLKKKPAKVLTSRDKLDQMKKWMA